MKVVGTGSIYRLYEDDLKTYNELPAQFYSVCFNNQTGFYLQKREDIKINEKVYGVHEGKVEKVLRSFNEFERNLGVILSGAKGIGKSLFAKMLSVRAVERDLPVIVVNTYYPGIASYLASIQQKAVVLFDEFEKTFPKRTGDETSPQTEMLTLFDGLEQGKKLFVVTCNDLFGLNDFLINRPGRFHYHFRFEYPTAEEIREYLEDKIPENAYSEIEHVIAFSRKINLNYDCLRSIAFELSCGSNFSDAIKDLNIININEEKYDVTIQFNDGTTAASKSVSFDLFSTSEENFWMKIGPAGSSANIIFSVADVKFSPETCENIIMGENIDIDWDMAYDDEEKKELEQLKKLTPVKLILKKTPNKVLHYLV